MSRDAFFFLAVVGEVTRPLAALHGAPWVGSRGPRVQEARRNKKYTFCCKKKSNKNIRKN